MLLLIAGVAETAAYRGHNSSSGLNLSGDWLNRASVCVAGHESKVENDVKFTRDCCAWNDGVMSLCGNVDRAGLLAGVTCEDSSCYEGTSEKA